MTVARCVACSRPLDIDDKYLCRRCEEKRQPSSEQEEWHRPKPSSFIDTSIQLPKGALP